MSVELGKAGQGCSESWRPIVLEAEVFGMDFFLMIEDSISHRTVYGCLLFRMLINIIKNKDFYGQIISDFQLI